MTDDQHTPQDADDDAPRPVTGTDAAEQAPGDTPRPDVPVPPSPDDAPGTDTPRTGIPGSTDIPGGTVEHAVEEPLEDAADDAADTADTVEAEVPAPAGDTAHGRLREALRPTFSRSQLLAGVLTALLGFALVAQVRHSGQDELASLRQDDLVRLLDDVTGRAEQLDAEVSRLQASRDELATGTDSARAALELAQARATAEGILSGRLPAEGPGVRVVVRDPDGRLDAMDLVNLLEELRNAGSEVAQVNGVRLTASSSFVDTSAGIEVDGTLLKSPFEWLVIGDPATIDRAIEIPGGALPRIRTKGATTDETEQLDNVTIDATVELRDPRFAQPVEHEE